MKLINLFLLIFSLLPSVLFAQDIQFEDLLISYSSKKDLLEVSISSKKQSFKAEVFIIEDPTRIGVDLLNLKLKGGLKKDIKNNLINLMRAGAHKDKVRIVFDATNKNSDLTYEIVEKTSSSIKFKILHPNTELEVASALNSSNISTENINTPKNSEIAPTNTTTNKAEILPINPNTNSDLSMNNQGANEIKKIENSFPKEEIIAPNTSSLNDNSKESIENVQPSQNTNSLNSSNINTGNINSANINIGSIVAENPSAMNGITQVQGLFFRAANNETTPAILVQTNRVSEYVFSQVKKNTYELIIENAVLSDMRLKEPQFPPKDYVGFEVIYADQIKNKVRIVIYITDATKAPTPSRIGNDIWIKAE